MPKYNVQVSECGTYKRYITYVVEASSPEEAREIYTEFEWSEDDMDMDWNDCDVVDIELVGEDE